MALLPVKPRTTVTAIFEHYETAAREQKPRPHLGASIIGKACSRSIWYDFRWGTRNQFAGRMLRLFDTGNQQENRMVVDLRNAGVTVYDKDPETKRQFQFKDLGMHLSGSMDASLLGVVEAPKDWHVGEFKTHNAESFKELVKLGVKAAKPQHWHQMNTYCGWTKMDDWFYFAVNKDTDALYCERGKFEADVFEADRAKARMIIESPRPLAKISDDSKWFECTFCDHHPICHVGQAPAVSCRTCVHATTVIDEATPAGTPGRWKCERYNVDLTPDQQLTACDSHLFIPDLLPFAEAMDAGEEFVVYKNKINGSTFANCTAVGFPTVGDFTGMGAVYPSAELVGLHPNLVGDSGLEEFRKELNGKVVPTEQPLKEVA